MISLTWSQVLTWRLSQQYLLQRPSRDQMLAVVTRLGGVQAQLMPAAEMAIAARLDGLKPAHISNALWEERSLIKTWVMRGTLHLLVAGDLPLFVAARAAVAIRRPPSYYTYHGVTPEEAQAILEYVPQVLDETPITREQLAEAVAQRAGSPNLRQVLLSGWGALLKPSAFRGEICFGPNQGQNVTFVLPTKWSPAKRASAKRVGQGAPLEPQAAFQEVARRYLNTYGPAAPEDFARWWGVDAGPAKKLFRSLGDELVEVEIEGRPAWALGTSIATLKAQQPAQSVRLLPMFDAYTVAAPRDCDPILPAEYKNRVYRPQGWISPVVLVDGRMAGVWESDLQRSRLQVSVEMFAPPPREVQSAILDEAHRLGTFLEAEVELEYRD